MDFNFQRLKLIQLTIYKIVLSLVTLKLTCILKSPTVIFKPKQSHHYANSGGLLERFLFMTHRKNEIDTF